jgi:hypothetical protein
MRWINGIKTIVVVLAIGLVTAACGGGEPTRATDAADPPEAPAPAESAAPVATPASVEIGQGFWFAGFHVTLGSASFDPSVGLVTVDATFENLGSEPAVFDGTSSLVSGGSSYESSATESLPTVPGMRTGSGEFVFDVDEGFAFEDASLTFGVADINQAVVPLDVTGEAVSLEPVPFAVSGEASAGAIAVDLTDAEVRADVPEEHGQVEAGHKALTIGFDVTNHGSYAGGFAFSYGLNLALELPDGTTIAADDGPIELLALGTTLPDQWVRFTIPDPATGEYRFVLIDDTESVRESIPFRIG